MVGIECLTKPSLDEAVSAKSLGSRGPLVYSPGNASCDGL